MKNTQIEKKNPAAPEHSTRVTFIPSEDDYLQIAACMKAAKQRSFSLTYLYWIFLFFNLICFPAYLLFQGYLLSAFVVFIVGGIFVIFLLPDSEKKAYRKIYRDLLKDGNENIEVEIFEKGLWFRYNENESIVAWKNITGIQDGRDSIYFFFENSGIPISKTAFGSEEQKKSFVDFAREHVRSAKLSLD
jgi:hypothetical protein